MSPSIIQELFVSVYVRCLITIDFPIVDEVDRAGESFGSLGTLLGLSTNRYILLYLSLFCVFC